MVQLLYRTILYYATVPTVFCTIPYCTTLYCTGAVVRRTTEEEEEEEYVYDDVTYVYDDVTLRHTETLHHLTPTVLSNDCFFLVVL